MNTRSESKISILNDTLVKIFGSELNLARIKFISLFIIALSKVQTVTFEKIAIAFENKVQTSSSLRRIQRFMAGYVLDTDIIARLIFALLPHEPPFRLALDRTNWKFGDKNINILVLAVVYQGVAFPVLFTMMDKRGNSSTAERISLMERYINLFGRDSIDCLLADREFVGEEWIAYLNRYNIRYHIRIRDNFYVVIPRNGHRVKASVLFHQLKLDQFTYHRRIVYVNNQLCYISASKVLGRDGKPELQVIISFNEPGEANSLYKQRWQIESAFRALKSSGFNMEDTHLTEMDRVEKLLSLVLIAFTWSYRIGIYLNQLKPIPIKKHGRRAYSFFKLGLNSLAKVININDLTIFNNYCLFLSCT
ncbi:hypothetical protein MNBD_BACTEROID07-1893 [hydrothermal vent metagenome]|uniref:Transposase IS4-like domain-containing protein n=1 Tax=hydrothermal vent metagenome TaxID=652676 RepID=A0A3B0VDB7_9ZZZZ